MNSEFWIVLFHLAQADATKRQTSVVKALEVRVRKGQASAATLASEQSALAGMTEQLTGMTSEFRSLYRGCAPPPPVVLWLCCTALWRPASEARAADGHDRRVLQPEPRVRVLHLLGLACDCPVTACHNQSCGSACGSGSSWRLCQHRNPLPLLLYSGWLVVWPISQHWLLLPTHPSLRSGFHLAQMQCSIAGDLAVDAC